MSSRVRHPAKSFLLFVLVLGGGWFAYENRHHFTGTPEEQLTLEQRESIREDIVKRWQDHAEFITVRAMSWRPREQRYRLDIIVEDTIDDPRPLCREIAEWVERDHEVPSTVVAVDSAGRELGRVVL